MFKLLLTRRIKRESPPQHPASEELEAWAKQLGLEPVLGPMIITSEQRLRVLRLLYQYRHLNREDLRDLPSTDLIRPYYSGLARDIICYLLIHSA